MNSNDQHLLVIGTIKDADPSAFGKAARGAPEKIVLEFFGTWLLEAEHLAAFRIDSRHDMPNGPVFPGAVHSLEDQEQCIPIGGIVEILQRAQFLHVLMQEFLVPLFRIEVRVNNRRPLAEIDLFGRRYTEIL